MALNNFESPIKYRYSRLNIIMYTYMPYSWKFLSTCKKAETSKSTHFWGGGGNGLSENWGTPKSTGSSCFLSK
jgi:hypothetical protein